MPAQSVRVEVPVRVADVGGWTDTWYGAPGRVCHVAVGPGVTVRARRRDDARVRLVARDIEVDTTWTESPPGLDPLLEAAVGDARGFDIHVESCVPPGASLGTSASVVVAMLAALDALHGDPVDAASLARRAHEVETVRLGRESGVQDQWAAATGGVNLLSIDPYPTVSREVVHPAQDLTGLLVTVVFGPHDSSATHQQVIGSLKAGHRPPELDGLAQLATEAASALTAGDLTRWGSVLTESTRLQAGLHPEIVGAPHRAAIEAAAQFGARGWKVNGAGGGGGSLTLLVPEPSAAGPLRERLRSVDSSWRFPDLAPWPGISVEHDGD